MSTTAWIGLGSNLGDRRAALDGAVAALAESPGMTLRDVSSYHETRPVGPGRQDAFLNAALSVETTLDPGDVLLVLHDVEARAGRVRSLRWGERTLDLDLLLYGDRVINSGAVANRVFGGTSTRLRVPHPRMAFRRFVLAPLAEIAPDVVDPLTGRTVSGLLANLDRRPSYVAIHDPWTRIFGLSDAVSRLFHRIVSGLGAVALSPGDELRSKWGWRPGLPSERTLPERIEETFSWMVEELDLDRWPADRVGGRWLVSDFWFDDLCWGCVGSALEAAWPDLPYHLDPGRFLESRNRVLIPAFVVVPSEHSAARYPFGRFPDRNRWFPPLGETPVLFPDALDVDGIADEVLAACSASRGD